MKKAPGHIFHEDTQLVHRIERSAWSRASQTGECRNDGDGDAMVIRFAEARPMRCTRVAPNARKALLRRTRASFFSLSFARVLLRKHTLLALSRFYVQPLAEQRRLSG